MSLYFANQPLAVDSDSEPDPNLAIAVFWSARGSLRGAELTRAWTIEDFKIEGVALWGSEQSCNPRYVSYIRAAFHLRDKDVERKSRRRKTDQKEQRPRSLPSPAQI